MKQFFYPLAIAVVCGTAVEAGFFDRVKKAAADAVEEKINETVDKHTPPLQQPSPPQKKPLPEKSVPASLNTILDSSPITSADDLYSQ